MLKKLLKDLINDIIEELDDFEKNYVYKPPDLSALKIKKSSRTTQNENQRIKELEEQKDDRIVVKDRSDMPFGSAIGVEDERIWFMIMTDFYNEKVTKHRNFEKILDNVRKTIPDKFQAKIMPLILNAADIKASFIQGIICNLLFKKHYGRLNNEIIDEYIDLFMEEISTNLIDLTSFEFISGIDLKVPEIKLDEGIILKKDAKEDFKSLEEFGHFFEKMEIIRPINVLIINKKVENTNLIYSKGRLVSIILRLFKVSDIHIYNRYQYQKTSFGKNQLVKTISGMRRRLFKIYTISEDESTQLVNFVKEIVVPFQKASNEEEFRNIMIALDRYDLALYGRFGIDQKFMFSVMGLESLLSTKEERSAHSLRMSFRAPKLLSFFNYPIETTRKNIKEAYKFRNQVVHGLEYNPNWEEEVRVLFPKVLNYLRILIIFRLLNLDINKKDLVNLIDNALLIESQDKKLEEVAKNCLNKFDLVFKASLPEFTG